MVELNCVTWNFLWRFLEVSLMKRQSFGRMSIIRNSGKALRTRTPLLAEQMRKEREKQRAAVDDNGQNGTGDSDSNPDSGNEKEET